MIDIYDGDHIAAWKNGDLVLLAFLQNRVMISIHEDDFPKVMTELAQVQANYKTSEKVKKVDAQASRR